MWQRATAVSTDRPTVGLSVLTAVALCHIHQDILVALGGKEKREREERNEKRSREQDPRKFYDRSLPLREWTGSGR